VIRTYFLIDQETWDKFMEVARKNGGENKCLNEALDFFLENAKEKRVIKVKKFNRKRRRIYVYINQGVLTLFKKFGWSPSLVFQSMIQTYLREVHKINI